VSSDRWAEHLLEAAALQPGDTVLDVGAELPVLAFAAHARIGDGWVIAVDPAPAVLEQLLRLAHEEGVNGIMYLVGDADVLPLPDDSVDVVLGRSLPVREGTALELARVVRPGGRVSLSETDPGELRRAGFFDVQVSGDLCIAARLEDR
jgi:ubiquinone/menaquinone biosynthesis C-methylase UbiE